MARVVLIINPRARRNRLQSGRIEEQRRIVEAHGGRAIVTDSVEHLHRSLVEVVSAGEFDVLALSGGDGSLHSGITTLRRAALPIPPILFVPSGTMNMLAISLELGTSLKLLRQVCAAAPESLERQSRDLMCINGSYWGFLFGTGLAANFLTEYYRRGKDGGFSVAAGVVRDIVISSVKRTPRATNLIRRRPTQVITDGQVAALTHSSVTLVQTIENLALGFAPMYRALEEPGTFHCIATDLSAAELVNRLPFIYSGQPWNHPKVHDVLARDLVLEFDGEVNYQVDGEVYSGGPRLHVVCDGFVQFITG